MNKLKQILGLFFLLIVNLASACEACEAAQPAITKGYTHGQGPSGNLDFVIVAVVAVIVVYTLIYSVKYLAKPGERKHSHIKYSILQD